MTPLPHGFPWSDLTAALRRAVYSCEFWPGTDKSGEPITLWVIMPFRFQAYY